MNNNFIMKYGRVREINNYRGNSYRERFGEELREEINRELSRLIEERTDDFGGEGGSDDSEIDKYKASVDPEVEELEIKYSSSITTSSSCLEKINEEKEMTSNTIVTSNNTISETVIVNKKDYPNSLNNDLIIQHVETCNRMMGSDELTTLNNDYEIVVGWGQDLSLITEAKDNNVNRYRRIIYTLRTRNNQNPDAGYHYVAAEVFTSNNRTIVVHRDSLTQELDQEFIDYVREYIDHNAMIVNINSHDLRQNPNELNCGPIALQNLDNHDGIVNTVRIQILKLNDLNRLNGIDNINVEDLLLESDPKIVFEYSDSDEEKEDIELGYENIKQLYRTYNIYNNIVIVDGQTNYRKTANLGIGQLTFVVKKNGEKKKSFLVLPINFRDNKVYNLKDIIAYSYDIKWDKIRETIKGELENQSNIDFGLFNLESVKKEVFSASIKTRLEKAILKEEIKKRYKDEKIPEINVESDNSQQIRHSEQQLYSFISNNNFINHICNFLKDNNVIKLHSVILDIISTNKMCTWCALGGYSIMFEANKDEFFEKLKKKIKEKIPEIKMSSNLKNLDNYKLIRVFHVDNKEKKRGVLEKILTYPAKREKWSIKLYNKYIIGTDIKNLEDTDKNNNKIFHYMNNNYSLFPSGNFVKNEDIPKNNKIIKFNENEENIDNNTFLYALGSKNNKVQYYYIVCKLFEVKQNKNKYIIKYIIYYDPLNSFVSEEFKEFVKQKIDKNAIILRPKDDRFILDKTIVNNLNTIINDLNKILTKKENKVKECINYINNINNNNFFSEKIKLTLEEIKNCTTIKCINEAIKNIKKLIEKIKEYNKINIFNESAIEELKKALNEDKSVENFGLEKINLEEIKPDNNNKTPIVKENVIPIKIEKTTDGTTTPQQSPETQKENSSEITNSPDTVDEKSIDVED